MMDSILNLVINLILNSTIQIHNAFYVIILLWFENK
jgi:hypothetical protein